MLMAFYRALREQENAKDMCFSYLMLISVKYEVIVIVWSKGVK